MNDLLSDYLFNAHHLHFLSLTRQESWKFWQRSTQSYELFICFDSSICNKKLSLQFY